MSTHALSSQPASSIEEIYSQASTNISSEQQNNTPLSPRDGYILLYSKEQSGEKFKFVKADRIQKKMEEYNNLYSIVRFFYRILKNKDYRMCIEAEAAGNKVRKSLMLKSSEKQDTPASSPASSREKSGSWWKNISFRFFGRESGTGTGKGRSDKDKNVIYKKSPAKNYYTMDDLYEELEKSRDGGIDNTKENTVKTPQTIKPDTSSVSAGTAWPETPLQKGGPSTTKNQGAANPGDGTNIGKTPENAVQSSDKKSSRPAPPDCLKNVNLHDSKKLTGAPKNMATNNPENFKSAIGYLANQKILPDREDNAKIDFMEKMAEVCKDAEDYGHAMHFSSKALDLLASVKKRNHKKKSNFSIKEIEEKKEKLMKFNKDSADQYAGQCFNGIKENKGNKEKTKHFFGNLSTILVNKYISKEDKSALKKKRSPVYVELGNFHLNNKKYKEAIEYYTKALDNKNLPEKQLDEILNKLESIDCGQLLESAPAAPSDTDFNNKPEPDPGKELGDTFYKLGENLEEMANKLEEMAKKLKEGVRDRKNQITLKPDPKKAKSLEEYAEVLRMKAARAFMGARPLINDEGDKTYFNRKISDAGLESGKGANDGAPDTGSPVRPVDAYEKALKKKDLDTDQVQKLQKEIEKILEKKQGTGTGI